MPKRSKVRVILIDPEKKEIRELHIEPELSRYYFWMGCDIVESVVREVPGFPEPVRLFVDEVGGFTDKPTFIIRTRYGNEELIGKALIVGMPDPDDGEETGCSWSLDDVRKFIFFDIPSLRRFIHDNPTETS